MVEFWLRAVSDPAVSDPAVRDPAVRDPAVRDHFVTHRRKIRDALVELLDEHAAARGAAFALPSGQLAIGIIALFDGFGLEHLIDPDAASPELFAHLLAGLLQAPPEAARAPGCQTVFRNS
ncbi:TetR family transcriptional regulator C-terminal domain-containing protein [Streptomyces corynorhini]|uniref:BetI-type transcriptional repressor C-terminal domain-containing protein n=1 Tax=Streptomyces corynorhini TaxID=2282652 RepID=A0A370B310_9ACTN|nr:TetR family transcriptional regulator C-terminal domain-containing protein [Streptomyces corynorhini]RDG34759.1 hypothetical protein DVH02_28955 [Streptomyces corynorhini]